jgi:hypothetical protein
MTFRPQSNLLGYRKNIDALEEIVGYKRDGQKIETETSKELRTRGRYWARHVLEVPVAWIMYEAKEYPTSS